MKSAIQFSQIFSFRGARLTLASASLLMLATFCNFSFLKTEAVGDIGKAPKEAVAQIKLNTIDGQQYSLAALRGKVVVLDFFGIHCAHSRDHIRETMTQYTNADFARGLQIIGIESESCSLEQIRQFIKEQGIKYPVAQIDEATFIRFVESRDLSAPQTLVFGRDGKLLLHTMGNSAKNEADIVAAIKNAL